MKKMSLPFKAIKNQGKAMPAPMPKMPKAGSKPMPTGFTTKGQC